MVALFVLYMACGAHGVDGRDCIATGKVESNFRTDAVSRVGCLGIGQVSPKWTPYPAWSLKTLIGGSLATARAIANYRVRHGNNWPRWYCCKTSSARKGHRVCLDHERKVNRELRKMGVHR